MVVWCGRYSFILLVWQFGFWGVVRFLAGQFGLGGLQPYLVGESICRIAGSRPELALGPCGCCGGVRRIACGRPELALGPCGW